MAHFDRVKPGGWVLNEVLDHALMNDLDTNMSKALNGDEGGTWAPSAEIVIGGSGLRLTTLLRAFGGLSVQGGDLAVSQDAAIQGTLAVDGESTLTGDVTCDHDLFVIGSLEVSEELDVASAARVHASLRVYMTSQFDDDITVSGKMTSTTAQVVGNLEVGSITCTSTASFTLGITASGGIAVNGDSTVTKKMVCGGQGRVVQRTVTGANADTSYSINDGDRVFVPPSTLTADRTYTLTHTGAVAGDIFEIMSRDAGSKISVADSVTGALDPVGIKYISGFFTSYRYLFDGTKWVALGGAFL